jgi:hypothetical protein
LDQAAKANASEADFSSSVQLLEFSQELVDILTASYGEKKAELRSIQKVMSPELPHYADLDWRLDVQIASRNRR